MYVADSHESRNLDRVAMDFGLAGLVLMENASRSIFQLALDFWPPLKNSKIPVFVLAGPGQNGGDGYVLARLFAAQGHPVVIAQVGSAPKGDAAINLALAKKLGLNITPLGVSSDPWPELPPQALLIDALLGTGLDRPVTGLFAETIEKAANHPGPKLAVDLPSGLSADTGLALGPVIPADLTATVGVYKKGLFLNDGPRLSGQIRVADLGFCPQMIEKARPQGLYLDAALARSFLPSRTQDGHKGTFGHACVMGGGAGKTGALALAALGALRSGVGLVTAASPKNSPLLLNSDLISAMTLPLPEESSGHFALEACEPLVAFMTPKKKALGLGPGLGLGQGAQELVRKLTVFLERPMLLDADALTALEDRPELVSKAMAPRLLTPHPGEAGLLLGLSPKEIQVDRFGSLSTLAKITKATVLLKGQYTLIMEPETGRYLVNSTGNPVLAVGGSGDILTGLLTGFLAQGLSPFAAAGLGAFVHGRAADLAASRLGSRGILPQQVAAFLPEVLTALADPNYV
ncbi:MAG: NAD(P)H-hydrate dehydratase [Deltaproteobacteria bacterium]|jgi:NAD(P)H-hydrate epimerase|nr:NAD(P)H-hydrate dehydratase [Deltaproteobacteria bacterium]